MPLVTKPAAATLERFVATQAGLDLSYGEVGATAGEPPPGYTVDRRRGPLGAGTAVFAAATRQLESWRPFDLTWMQAWPADTPLQEGATVAVMARSLGLWWLNACRIVYVIDEPRRRGFAYGTLPRHAARGEERFQVEIDEQDQVWFEILAFSRPHGLLSRAGYPQMRRLQRRFGRDSLRRMQEAVAQTPGDRTPGDRTPGDRTPGDRTPGDRTPGSG